MSHIVLFYFVVTIDLNLNLNIPMLEYHVAGQPSE